MQARGKPSEQTDFLSCDQVHECTWSHAMVSRYQADPARVRRISGPFLDRIDIHIEVPRVEYKKLSGDWMGCYNWYAPF